MKRKKLCTSPRCDRVRSVLSVGWEEDVPELGRRSGEFDGDEGAVGVELRRADDVGFDFFLGLGILNRKLSAHGDAFRQDNHSAAGADGVRETVERMGFSRNVNDHRHLQQDALGAAALFGGLRTSH